MKLEKEFRKVRFPTANSLRIRNPSPHDRAGEESGIHHELRAVVQQRFFVPRWHDDLAVLHTRFKLLAAQGYGVLSASNAAQALQVFADHPVDVVLMDYAPPEMDGGMLADAMMNDFVTKGAGLEALINSIHQVLNASVRRGQREMAS